MAFRPTGELIDGELDNTMLGRVTGWMRFRGIEAKVSLHLKGDCSRDIRGATIKIRPAQMTQSRADCTDYMADFEITQTGWAGCITAGRPPHDCKVNHPFIEWFSHENGRVVLEPHVKRIRVVGSPIPASKTQPVPWSQHARNRAWLSSVLGRCLIHPDGPPPISRPIKTDPAFTHWIFRQHRVVGEARDIEPAQAGLSFAVVRRFAYPEIVEEDVIPDGSLRAKRQESQGQL